MHKLLIYIAICASLTACSSIVDNTLDKTEGIFGQVIPKSLDQLPLVYKPEIQQGNIVTQEMINQLQPGQLKRQVRFILGTPMLTDPFHDGRWDYLMEVKIGDEVIRSQQLAVFFEDDRLVRIEGDRRPGDPVPENELMPEKVVSVPDWVPPKRTLLERLFGWAGVGEDTQR
jgi:outer membrane protein assembly factor BamE